jgi:hypothetical protein
MHDLLHKDGVYFKMQTWTDAIERPIAFEVAHTAIQTRIRAGTRVGRNHYGLVLASSSVVAR